MSEDQLGSVGEHQARAKVSDPHLRGLTCMRPPAHEEMSLCLELQD